MAVQDPEPQQQPPQQPQPVTQLLKAAAAGQAAKTAAGAAIVAPAVAVTLPARAAVGAVSVPAEAFVHGVKIAIILKVLRRLLRWHSTDSTDWVTKELMRLFPNADPAVIRAAVENEMKLERLFQEKAIKRVTAALQAAGQLPTLEAQQAKVQAILKLEQHYAQLREKVMLQRAKAHVENAGVKDRSPEGARWNLGPTKNHTLGCLALAGKTWPWSVLDAIQPPLHPGCGCYLTPLAPGDSPPPQGGDALNAAKAALALEEAIRENADPGELEAALDGQEVRPVIAHALTLLQEVGGSWKDWLHPRGRGGKWIDVPGGGKKFDFGEHEGPKPPHVADKPYVPKPDPHMPDLSPGSTVVSGPKPTGETRIGGDVPEPAEQGPIPDFGHIPLTLQPSGFAAETKKARGNGEDYLVRTHGGDRSAVASELLSNAVYRQLGIDTPTMGHVRTEPEPDFAQRPDDLKKEPSIDAPEGARISTGVILREKDGRITLIEPRNHYGGYVHTFPKGGVEPNLTPQQNAHKELWEETGLHAHITGVVGDFKGDTGVSRYYVGVRTGGEATPSSETQAIKTVTPDEAAKMLNKQRDQDILKKLTSMPIPKGEFEDQFPPDVQGSALAFKAESHTKTKQINEPNEALGKGYMTDALLANRNFLGGLRWRDDNTPIRTDMASTLGYSKGKRREFGDTPSEVWKMRYRGQAAGTVAQTEDQMRQQANQIANTLTDAKIEELTKAAPFPSEAERQQMADTLKARVGWMRRFADGQENLPQPVSGQEARTTFADAQDGFDIYPEEQQALDAYAGAAGRTLDDHLRDGKGFTSEDRKAVKRLDAVLGATETPEDAHVYVGADAAPTKDMVGKTFSMKSYIRAHTNIADVPGNTRIRLLVPGGGRMLHLDDAPKGEPDMVAPRDQRIRISGLSTGPDGKRTLDAILMPHQNPRPLPGEYKPPKQTGFGYSAAPSAPQTTFKKGDRVDINGNKATVTGTPGGNLVNVKLDSGKGYTVPHASLKKLEEAASFADFKEWLHPRGRGGEWIGSGSRALHIGTAATAIKDVTAAPPKEESIARIQALGIAVETPGKHSKISAQELSDIADVIEDAYKQYPILSHGPGAPLTRIAFASHKFGKKMMVGVLADTGIRKVSHKEGGWKPESVITFNDRYNYHLKPAGPPPPDAHIGGQLSVSSRSWAGVAWHELGHAMVNATDMAGHHDSKRYEDWMSRYGVSFEDCKAISTYATASRSEGIAELCSMENTPGYKSLLPPDLQPKVAKMFSDLRNWDVTKPYVYQKPLPGSTPAPKPLPKIKAPSKGTAKVPANLADIEAKVKANPGTAGPKMPVSEMDLKPGDVFEGSTPGGRYLTISDSTAKGGLSYVPLNQGKTVVYRFSATSKRRKVNLHFEESAMLDLSPEAVAKAEAAARENLAAGDWVAPDPFLDENDPPPRSDVEEAIYKEALHPRGRGGKWIGKGISLPKVSEAPSAPKSTVERIVDSLGGKAGDEGYRALAAGEALDTQHIHQVNGKYTAARQLQHQEIINHFFKDAKPAKGKAQAIFTAGGAASGKSTLAGQSSHTEANLDIPDGAVYINPDNIKEMLPEYNALKKQGREDVAAAAVHEESSDIAKLMTRLAMSQNYPIIVDGTGDSKVGKFGSKLAAARDAGYDVEARYAHVPVTEALAREQDRAKRTGRKVAESLLREQHQTVAQSYVEDVSKMPGIHVKVYSTVARGKPTLIADKPPDGPVKVLDEKQYAEHVAKAKVEGA